MVKLETIKELLDITEEELKDFETEKLRDILGVLHYATRLVDHELGIRIKE